MSTTFSTFEEILEKEGVLLYTNVGTSMMPLLREGRDIMVIEKKGPERCKKYDVPLYKRDNGQYILHRILEVREHDYVICGDNQWHKETGITDRHILGVLKAVIRDGKEISVDDLEYLRYVHKKCDHFWLRAGMYWLRDLPFRIRRKLKRMLR